MAIELRLKQELKQGLKLSQAIQFSKLMSVPDEVLSAVAGAILYTPDSIEGILREQKVQPGVHDDKVKKVQTIYSSFLPSKGDAEGSGKGIVPAPDLRALEGRLGDCKVIATPDVTYIGRKSEKPEVVFSDHLKGSTGLFMLQVDSSKYPESSRLLDQLKRFDDWKRSKLRDSYVLIGGAQREFLEDFDPLMYRVFTQEKLARVLGNNAGTISRLLSCRWAEARSISGEQRVIYAKDFFVSSADLMKYAASPMLNNLFQEEFEHGKALSDSDISKKIRKVARRTITKYRMEHEIPDVYERSKAYKEGSRKEPYKIA